MAATVQQHWAIGEEVLTSIRLIEAGLGHLQRIDGANDFYHLPMLLLASGFERLMKTIICFSHLRQTGSYPPKKFFHSDRQGHNLVRLLDDIVSQCFRPAYLNRPAAADDVDYLRTDPRLRKLIEILSDFGQAARYYHLDFVLKRKLETDSPEQTWQQLELDVLREDGPEWLEQLKPPANLTNVYQKITNDLVVRFEKFARALVRLFTIGDLGDEAKRHTGTIGPFLYLMDGDLGRRDYSQNFRAWRARRSSA